MNLKHGGGEKKTKKTGNPGGIPWQSSGSIFPAEDPSSVPGVETKIPQAALAQPPKTKKALQPKLSAMKSIKISKTEEPDWQCVYSR